MVAEGLAEVALGEITKMKELTNLEKLFVAPIGVVLMLINQGFANSLTWNLFMPKFFGLPELSVLTSILLLCVVTGFMGRKSKTAVNRTKEDVVRDVFIIVVSPWFIFLVALITSKIYF